MYKEFTWSNAGFFIDAKLTGGPFELIAVSEERIGPATTKFILSILFSGTPEARSSARESVQTAVVGGLPKPKY